MPYPRLATWPSANFEEAYGSLAFETRRVNSDSFRDQENHSEVSLQEPKQSKEA